MTDAFAARVHFKIVLRRLLHNKMRCVSRKQLPPRRRTALGQLLVDRVVPPMPGGVLPLLQRRQVHVGRKRIVSI
jgi:hypothetical protein